jgi:hypothetical protein
VELEEEQVEVLELREQTEDQMVLIQFFHLKQLSVVEAVVVAMVTDLEVLLPHLVEVVVVLLVGLRLLPLLVHLDKEMLVLLPQEQVYIMEVEAEVLVQLLRV